MYKIICLVFAATALLALPGCGGINAGQQPADLAVATAITARTQVESIVDVAGVLTPGDTATVSSKMSGSVKEVYVSTGQTVGAGEVLARLDTKELEAQLASAVAAYNTVMSQSDIARINLEAAQSGLISTKSVVEDQEETAKIAMDTAKTALDDAKIQSNLQIQQNLLQIEQTQLGIDNAQKVLESAEKSLEIAQKNYDRTVQLIEAEAAPQANLDTAESGLNTAQASVNTANSGLVQAQAANRTAQAAYRLAEQSAVTAIDTAQARYDSAVAAYNQASGSAADSQITAAQGRVDAAQEQYNASASSAPEQAQAAINAIEVQLGNAEITANIGGMVVNRNINAGEIAAAGSPLFTLADVSKLKLKGTFSQDVLPYIKEGQPVDVIVDIYPDRVFPGSLTGIGPIAVSTGSYFPCEITIDNKDNDIAAGVSAHASIRITGASRITVPNAAIIQNNGQTYVFVIKDNIAYKKDVVPGLKNDAETEILRGLEEGEAVAVSNVNTLFDQTPIPIQP